MGERDGEVSSLNSKLLSLQADIKNLHDVCKRQGKTLQENQLCVEEAMMNSSHVRDSAAASHLCSLLFHLCPLGRNNNRKFSHWSFKSIY